MPSCSAAACTLFVDGADDRGAASSPRRFPPSASRDYGRPFAQIFKDFEYDFYKIDPMLFAPAEVLVCNLAYRQRAFRGGARDGARLAESFGL